MTDNQPCDHTDLPEDPDEAVLRMLAGANFGPGASIILPSGRKMDGDEAQALTSFHVGEDPRGAQ